MPSFTFKFNQYGENYQMFFDLEKSIVAISFVKNGETCWFSEVLHDRVDRFAYNCEKLQKDPKFVSYCYKNEIFMIFRMTTCHCREFCVMIMKWISYGWAGGYFCSDLIKRKA